MAQPTVHAPTRAELAYRAHLLTVISKITSASTTLRRSAGSIDPSHADFDPSVLQTVTGSIDSANRSLEEVRASLTAMSVPRSLVQTQQQTRDAIELYGTAAQHLRQAVNELEAGTLDTSSSDLTVGTSSLQQGDQALQSAQSLLAPVQ